MTNEEIGENIENGEMKKRNVAKMKNGRNTIENIS